MFVNIMEVINKVPEKSGACLNKEFKIKKINKLTVIIPVIWTKGRGLQADESVWPWARLPEEGREMRHIEGKPGLVYK